MIMFIEDHRRIVDGQNNEIYSGPIVTRGKKLPKIITIGGANVSRKIAQQAATLKTTLKEQ